MSADDKHKKDEHGHGDGGGGSHGNSHGHGGGHGGGGHEEHEGAPEWLISFADNVTLMMGFFVILLAMNMKSPTAGGIGGKDKNGDPPSSPDMIDAVLAIREGFKNPVNLASTDPDELPLIRRVLERREKGFSFQKGVPGDRHNVQSLKPSKYSNLCGSVPFDEQSAELNDATRGNARDIAMHFRGMRTVIEVRGHCGSAEAAALADRGMRLCFDRATVVAAEMVKHGIDDRQLRLVACGDHDRVKALAYDDAAQRKNQRVEVIFIDEVMPANGEVKAGEEATEP